MKSAPDKILIRDYDGYYRFLTEQGPGGRVNDYASITEKTPGATAWDPEFPDGPPSEEYRQNTLKLLEKYNSSVRRTHPDLFWIKGKFWHEPTFTQNWPENWIFATVEDFIHTFGLSNGFGSITKYNPSVNDKDTFNLPEDLAKVKKEMKHMLPYLQGIKTQRTMVEVHTYSSNDPFAFSHNLKNKDGKADSYTLGTFEDPTLKLVKGISKKYTYIGEAIAISMMYQKIQLGLIFVVTPQMVRDAVEKYTNGDFLPSELNVLAADDRLMYLSAYWCERTGIGGRNATDGTLPNPISRPMTVESWVLTLFIQRMVSEGHGNCFTTTFSADCTRVDATRKLLAYVAPKK